MSNGTTLAEILERIQEALEKSKQAVAGQSPPDKTTAAARLDDAEGDIDIILDPGQSPSLDPVDSGSIMPQLQHGSFTACIDYQINLADEAVEEAAGGNDQDYIGDRIRTIKSHLDETRDLLDQVS